jgi:hypothetical protein
MNAQTNIWFWGEVGESKTLFDFYWTFIGALKGNYLWSNCFLVIFSKATEGLFKVPVGSVGLPGFI